MTGNTVYYKANRLSFSMNQIKQISELTNLTSHSVNPFIVIRNGMAV